MARILGIVLYAIGGFFVYTANLLSFTFMPTSTIAMKLGIMAIFGVLGLIALLAAMATSGFKNCKTPLGITLLAGAGFNIFCVLTIICMEASPEITKSLPDYPHNFFSDYITGGITTICLVLAGIVLVRPSSRQAST